MSIRGWTYGAVSAASLLATTAFSQPGETAANRSKRPAPAAPTAAPAADVQARPTGGKKGDAVEARDPQGAAAHANGDHGRSGERGNSVAAAAEHGPGAERAAGDPGRDGPDQEGGRPDSPPRAAIEALKKARSFTEAEAIAHLRAQGAGANAAPERARRDEVRRERAKELHGRLKSRGIPNQLRAELRTHARRIAQIERIRALAAADAKLITRIDAMLVRENERHTRRMTRLVDEVNQAPAEAAAATPTEAAPVAAEAPVVDTAQPTTGSGEPQKPSEQGVTP